METYYHGTSVLFKEFNLAHVLEGDGKVKFGYGVYVTSKYRTAAHYAGANPTATIIVATTGNWLGGITSYGIGRAGKWEWIEKLRVSRESLEKQQKRIERFGAPIALLTWVPFIGDVFAVALGFYRVKFVPAILWMLVGKAARFICWYLIWYAI